MENSQIEPQYISLDIENNKTYQYIYSKQYDEGRNIIFNITQNGEPFDLTGMVATFQMKKTDGTIVINDCTITDNRLSILLTNQMTICFGKMPFQIQLIKDKSVITTITGYFKISESVVHPEDVVSSDEFNALTHALIKVNSDYTYVMESAQASADAAKLSETNAKTSEINAKSSEDSALESATLATAKASEASTSANNANTSANKAKTSETNAKSSETNAKVSENNAYSSALNAKTSETNASASASTASAKATEASTSASNAKKSETNASNSATSASNSASSATSSANTAISKATEASNSATSASNSASTATTKANEATNYALKAESFTQGGTGTRENEDVSNAQYYYKQVKQIAEGLNGTLLPMGTITFLQLLNLPVQSKQSGYMYNISDSFTTNDTFKEGAGFTYPAGTNVYYTYDGYWDCLAGTMVTGIKGNAESSYRKGNVNITMSNLGYGNVENKSSEDIRNEITKDNVTNALGYTPSYEVISETEPEPTTQNIGDFWLQAY